MISNRKLKRILQEKPFLLDGFFQLSGREADDILRNHPNAGSIERIIEKTRRKENWTPEFEYLIRKITENTLKAKWRRLLSRVQNAWTMIWHLHKRLVVVTIALVALSVFFGLTPVGRTLADELYQVIVTFFNETLRAENDPSLEGLSKETLSSLPSDLATPKELSAAIGRPIYVSQVGEMVSFEYEVIDNNYLMVFIDYSITAGKEYKITQYYYSKETYWGSVMDGNDSSYTCFKSEIGLKFYIKELKDYSINASAFQNHFGIDVAGNVTVDDIHQIILSLTTSN